MVSQEIQQLRATLDGLVREQADRRALRERQGEEIKARAQEYMTEQVQAAERYVQLRRELGKQSEADEEDEELESFGEPEEFAEEDAAAAPPPAATPPAPASPPPPPPAPEPVRAARAPRRPAQEAEEEDDDDFLNIRWRDDD
ncbi:hypothetical protein FPZ12_027115 [Amycolatopsis acidicola]|uniref:Uncharacterized protein n=1 Tax=Amycolatopsis acidicola TaxID=2596893 RepID=A0A5N0UYK2_9PSEU|nr:hypothetical protein [Amycolatopsis acidicola]KAA9156706.1 hypothetical protein FPZ12_027115 [Amycolatopsis acidicola]